MREVKRQIRRARCTCGALLEIVISGKVTVEVCDRMLEEPIASHGAWCKGVITTTTIETIEVQA